jgi:hypothetical protein
MERARFIFMREGYDTHTQDPAALAVKGRLLKDRGFCVAQPQARAEATPHGITRLDLLTQAAQAYAAADSIAPAPYLRINTAALNAMTGDTGAAHSHARAVLKALDHAPPYAETPYYTHATKAEALLILGEQAEAEAALQAAIAASPKNYGDLAGTLKQFERLCAALDMSTAWLDAARPPACLNYAGHMGIEAGGACEQDLVAKVQAFLAHTHIGFAYGALAAGADIIMAETLLRHKVQLHVILPSAPDVYLQQSVAPAGEAWVQRFHAVLEQAHELRIVSHLSGTHDPAATQLANEIAMGCALEKASALSTYVHQLVALDPVGGGLHSAKLAARWGKAKRPQSRITIARDARTSIVTNRAEAHSVWQCLAGLHIALDNDYASAEQSLGAHKAMGQLIADMCAARKVMAASASHFNWHIWLKTPLEAVQMGLALQQAMQHSPVLAHSYARLFAHYSLLAIHKSANLQMTSCVDAGFINPNHALDTVPQGVFMASADFAAALSLETQLPVRVESSGYDSADAAGAIYMLIATGG